MNIYLAGQTNFGNRGCEALVRSSASMIKNVIPGATILCPLENINCDAVSWPEAYLYNVKYVSSPKFPQYIRWWARANKLLPLERFGIPKLILDRETISHLNNTSILLMTGGDNLTLDYGVMALYQWCGIVEKSIQLGIPAILWAASIGPFTDNPGVEKVMTKHLKRYSAITVRESITKDYLRSIGVHNVELVTDPAFCLEPEPCEFTSYIEGKHNNLVGLNVSPLITRFRKYGLSAVAVDKEIEKFVLKVIKHTSLNVILISHVDNYQTRKYNSDWQYLKSIYSKLGAIQDRIILAPNNLNAAQVKSLIGLCKYFVGARTHSTIAALSQCIPTISLAYSVKAKGINVDLFDHQEYVLSAKEMDAESLFIYLQRIIDDRDKIINILNEKIPKWRRRANYSAELLKKYVGTC